MLAGSQGAAPNIAATVLSIYCGVPQALECFRAARKVLEEKQPL